MELPIFEIVVKDIVLEAYIGDNIKIVTLECPSGNGGGAYYIMCERYVHGQVVHYTTGWKAFINPTSFLTYEDGQILEEMAEKNAKI